ncbi:MAG: tyrosine-type recombinase/integrase [Erysipelotrichaceae bacterium]|nr:tyrosine-type recombinase/integrase [Erysipelotrichaceae bacterium]
MSVSLRKDGWYDVEFHLNINGKRKHFCKRRVSKSKKEAKKFELEFRDSLKGQKKIAKFNEVFELRNAELERNGRSPSTLNTYKHLMSRYIMPYFVNKDIGKYKTHDVELFIQAAQEKGISNYSINHCLELIRAVFNYAKKKGFMAAVNPVENIETLKTEKRPKPYYFNHPEFLKFIEVVKQVEQEDANLWECIWTMLFELGLRKSELEPLQVKDINFEHMTVSINKHMIEGQGPVLIVPGRKNGEGYEAPLSKKLAELLKIRIKKLEQFDGYTKEAYLFNSDSIFAPAARSTLKRHLDKATKAGGFEDTTPHAFRHMCCLNLVELGADVFTIANHIKDTVELVEKVYGGRIKSHVYARTLLDSQNEEYMKEADNGQ